MKAIYQAPAIEVLHVEYEGGVMAGSITGSGINDMTPGTWSSTRNTGARSGNSSTTLSDVEDMIRDILEY